MGSADRWLKLWKFPSSASAKGSPVELGFPLTLKLMAPLGESGREFWSLRLRAYIAPNLKVWLPICQVKLSEGEMSVVGASKEKKGPVNWAGAAVGNGLPMPEKVTCGIPLGNLPALANGKGIWNP